MKMKIIRNDKSPLNPSHVRYLHRIKIEGTYLMDYSSIICETTSETKLSKFQKYLRLTYFLVASIKGISMGRMRYPMYWQTLSEFVKRTKCKVKRTRTEQIIRYNLVPHLRSWTIVQFPQTLCNMLGWSKDLNLQDDSLFKYKKYLYLSRQLHVQS